MQCLYQHTENIFTNVDKVIKWVIQLILRDENRRCKGWHFHLWGEHVCGHTLYELSKMLHLVVLITLQKVVGSTRHCLLQCVLDFFFFFFCNYCSKIKLNEYKGKDLHLIRGDVRTLSLQKTAAESIKPGKEFEAKAFSLRTNRHIELLGK